MKQTRNRRWTVAGLVVLGLLGLVPVTAALTSTTAGAEVAEAGDGATSATAGASCWGIKQQHATSEDGTYWLLTASMDRPDQFHCDMTTNGGGWVLVARGRNGWSFNPAGQRAAADVRNVVDGPAAFAPAALGTETIDQLLDHANLAAAPDGIRLERSLDASGGTRQDYRLFSPARSWTWNLAAGQLLNRIVVNGSTYQGSNTADTSTTAVGQKVNGLSGINDSRRLVTKATANHNNVQGFSFGNVIGGSSAADNHLWTSAGEPAPLPFTRVWLRPQIANDAAGFSAIPAAGYPAEAKPLALKNRSELAPWGVVGIDHTNETMVSPWKNNVSILKVYGDRVYVGGRFTGVQQGPGQAPIAQRSLAAFDLDGNWISTFRPAFEGRVWDLTMTADGKLIVGGDFLSVDGTPGTSGLVALDPATGAVDPSWKGSVTRNGGRPTVRALDSDANYVYVAGRFNRATGGTSTNIGVPNTVSLRNSDAQPGQWRPVVHASAARVRVSEDGSRVYMGGWFNAVNDDTNQGFYAVTNRTDGSPAAGIGAYQPSTGSRVNNWYQQAVAETGDRLLVGGAEHTLQMYDRDRTTLLNSHITKQGGDFQAIEVIDGQVYASCHCMNWNYSGTNNWSAPSGYRAVDPIRMVGRYDAATLDYDTSWFPNGLKGATDEGVWGIAQDKNKCLWVGGDLVRGSYSGDAARDWLGGFARFCGEDSTVPTTPTNLSATVDTSSVNLTWTASTDATAPIRYDVYRNDRVIATVTGTSFTDTPDGGASGSLQYTVRAADVRGNRSASPAPVAVNGPAPQLGSPIEWGATWRYADAGDDLGTTWRDPQFDDEAWATGPAVLGWNAGQATDIGPSRPTTSYFRTSFDLADPSAVAMLDIQAKVSQGAVVYVNGIEAGRYNMPDGDITSSTTAATYVGGTENGRVKSFTVPAGLLVAGRNTVAVEVHGWRANSGLLLFDLAANTVGATADDQAPSAPVASAAAVDGQTRLTWTASTDDTALGGYVVNRDGTPLAVVAPQTTAYVVPGVEAHTFAVVAFDAAGNTTSSVPVQVGGPPVVDPPIDPEPQDQELMAFGSTWRWTYPTSAPAGNWFADAYDDQAWASGAGQFGFGPNTVTTISDGPTPRPLTSYYRTTVDIADPGVFQGMVLDLVRNGGAAVYVNGIEVTRANLPAGPLSANTYATAAVPAADRQTPVSIEVPTSAFRAGSNTIAVELHLNWKSQTTAGFDLRLTGLAGQAG